MTNLLTGIEWTDAAWNPVTGCTAVSPGCDHCYAHAIATRFAGTQAFPHGFSVTLRPERLGDPLHWRQPRRVFVNSMSDLFHRDVPDEYIAEVFAVMAAAHRHTFQILTKRHARMRALLADPDFRALVGYEQATLAHQGVDITISNVWENWPLPNVWLGVSTENQQWATIRIPALLQTPAVIRFVSAEPLLGPINLAPAACLGVCEYGRGHTAATVHVAGCCTQALSVLDWVIVGGESGPAARPMHPHWASSLRDQCAAAQIPFFFKQWGNWVPQPTSRQQANGPSGQLTLLTPDGTRHSPRPDVAVSTDAVLMARHGKARAGRTLDGRTWDQYPTTPGGGTL